MNIVITESQEQQKVVQYLKFKKILFFSVPNGSFLNGDKLKRIKQMNRLKAEGLQNGVPDICILFDDGKALFIEMKKKNKSTTSIAQKEWNKELNKLGYFAYICKGAQEAISVIDKHHKKKG